MNETDSITANYTFGPGIDNPLLMHRNSKNYYYVKDGLGSVMGLTDSTGSVVKEYQYSVFGKIVKETGMGILNPFAYTGREYDSETGNYYYRARYYDAGIGRFLSEDPIGFAGGDNNFYRYLWNDPVNWIDPSGENAAVIGAVVSIGIVFPPEIVAVIVGAAIVYGVCALSENIGKQWHNDHPHWDKNTKRYEQPHVHDIEKHTDPETGKERVKRGPGRAPEPGETSEDQGK